MNSICPSFRGTAGIYQPDVSGRDQNFLCDFKARELGKYMANTLDEEWNQMRGMEIQSVGIASVSYDEESQKSST